ncbi:MAG: hypothetical protein ABI461_11975 [Polyangiaceae bacterium]
MLLVLGIVALLVVLAAVGSAMLIGARQARQEDGPESHPTDFVARAGQGAFAFRTTSESTSEFKARLEKEASAPDSRDLKSPSK